MRGLAVALCLLAAPAVGQDACTPGDGAVLERACFLRTPEPATPYGHNVLGDTPEWATLSLDWGAAATDAMTGGAPSLVFRLQDGIFEDIAPRVIELGDDPLPEVLVVQSETGNGARALILDINPDGVRAIAGPWIGTTYRWLAPVGVADLDGDGAAEVAWVDRPHLARTLRVFRVDGDRLVETAHATGLTNHRIGDAFITGGIRRCDDTPEMITVDAGWTRIIASRFDGQSITSRDIGAFTGQSAIAAALSCR